MKIPPAIINDLFNNNIRVENTFVMEVVTACDSLPQTFWEAFESEPEEILNRLGLKQRFNPDGLEIKDKCDLLDFLHEQRARGVLVHFSTPVPIDIEFNAKGDFSTCSIGWNRTVQDFAYGHTIEEALANAVKQQDTYFDHQLKAAKTKHKFANQDPWEESITL